MHSTTDPAAPAPDPAKRIDADTGLFVEAIEIAESVGRQHGIYDTVWCSPMLTLAEHVHRILARLDAAERAAERRKAERDVLESRLLAAEARADAAERALDEIRVVCAGYESSMAEEAIFDITQTANRIRAGAAKLAPYRALPAPSEGER